jgi:RNA polymerase sigma factor (sigma-70 family)
LRSDDQLVALFRAGHEDAFRVIHDRYRPRLFAYTRQMLPGSRHDAEDALQDIFVRAYAGLRSNNRKLALRAWLYRVAHNRCIDELRRPKPPAPEVYELIRGPASDPIAEAERRDSLRRLLADIRRLPEQQRSALLMRELGGVTYLELSTALGVSVPAVKSLLVRARVGLAQALEARDTNCAEIRDELVLDHDRGVRPSAVARRHLHDCAGCREFRVGVRGMSRQLAILAPALGPFALIANLLGFGGGAGGAAGGGGAAAAGTGGAIGTGGVVGTGGALASAGALVGGAGHVATILAAAVVTAGGAVEVQSTLAGQPHHRPPAHQAPANPPAVAGSSVAQAGAAAAVAPSAPQAFAPALDIQPPRQAMPKPPGPPGAGAGAPSSAGSGGAADPAGAPASTDGSTSTATGTFSGPGTSTGAVPPDGTTSPGSTTSTGTASGWSSTPGSPTSTPNLSPGSSTSTPVASSASAPPPPSTSTPAPKS